eukprot:765641-Hanusia_phi.AAC.4
MQMRGVSQDEDHTGGRKSLEIVPVVISVAETVTFHHVPSLRDPTVGHGVTDDEASVPLPQGAARTACPGCPSPSYRCLPAKLA